MKPIVVADTHRLRREGLNFKGAGALLLWTRSVHTFTMANEIRLTTIAPNGRVLGSVVLPPNRLVLYRSAQWVLETSASVDPPDAGVTLIALRLHDDDWKAHDLRNPDWQPW